MSEWIAAVLLVVGAVIALIAAVGVLRLPDAFLRMHAATKAGVVGGVFALLGVGAAFDTPGAWLRVGLIIVFLLMTVPVSSHALGRAAYVSGAPMWQGTRQDDLEGVLPRAAREQGVENGGG
jgi:multicomponent Na+:H+ antiporter subunit G